MLTHSRIVERSMERSLHVEARGRTIVFGTYLDVIRDRLAIVDRRAERCRCTLASSLSRPDGRSRAFDEIAKWGRPWRTIIKWLHKGTEKGIERGASRKSRGKTRPRGSLAFWKRWEFLSIFWRIWNASGYINVESRDEKYRISIKNKYMEKPKEKANSANGSRVSPEVSMTNDN